MADGRSDGYADAVLAVARAEGDEAGVTDELFRFAQALRSSNELRTALTDGAVEPARRQQIVEDLLGGRARPRHRGPGVDGGRRRPGRRAARDHRRRRRPGRGRPATGPWPGSAARWPSPTTSKTAWPPPLRSATGADIEVRVIVDPGVIGGVITEIGDDVIDGSVRSRLGQMRAGLA